MFEAGKGFKCFANDARVSIKNWKKNNLNDFITKTKPNIRDLDHLKEVPRTFWEQVSQDLMNKAIDPWLDRISPVIRTKGGHIQHRLQ